VLEFRILGPLEVARDGVPLQLGGPKQRATLAILLLSPNRVVPVDRLADDLYAGAAPVTAVTQVQRQISDLRKALGSESAIETRAPGYVLNVSGEQLDLSRFERLAEEGSLALSRGKPQIAARLLREALGVWRGSALADLGYMSFAQTAIARLDELRLVALERRIEADLRLGRHADLVGELEELSVEYPLREAVRKHLMLALYRSNRQADALDVYRRTRQRLVEELGIEPSRDLQELERAILTQEPALDSDAAASPAEAPDRAVLVMAGDDDRLDTLLVVAEPLARAPRSELILARMVASETELAQAAVAVNARRGSVQVAVRAAAFTTTDPSGDAVRFATSYDVELILAEAPSDLDPLPEDVTALLERSPADVALLKGAAYEDGDAVYVPFGGGEHDWAALELGARIASSWDARLRLVGTAAQPDRDRRDASRLLADAVLALQRVIQVESEPVLAAATEEALATVVDGASLVVVGLPPRWRRAGIGSARRALLESVALPVLLVHRGPRPGVLAPRDSHTRFTWSLGEVRSSAAR
jgi:DNA-binding SARP family transcriptional activator